MKKPLSQRWHVFPDGVRVQRDLYAAWLARFVEADKLDASQCGKHWAAAEPLLRRAASSFHQSASGTGFALPHVHQGVGVDRPLKGKGRRDEAADAVAPARAADARRDRLRQCRHLRRHADHWPGHTPEPIAVICTTSAGGEISRASRNYFFGSVEPVEGPCVLGPPVADWAFSVDWLALAVPLPGGFTVTVELLPDPGVMSLVPDSDALPVVPEVVAPEGGVVPPAPAVPDGAEDCA